MNRGARIGDKHKCPQQTPVPHVGGLVIGAGAPKVSLQHVVGCVEGDTWDFATEGAKYTCIHILDEIDG